MGVSGGAVGGVGVSRCGGGGGLIGGGGVDRWWGGGLCGVV